MENIDKKVVACNYVEATKTASVGALCYVSITNYGNLNENLVVVLKSRGGRWIRKWESARRLGNFRFKTLPPEHPRYNDDRIASHLTDRDVEQFTIASDNLRSKQSKN